MAGPGHRRKRRTLIAHAVGWKARLERFTGEERFDILPLLVATDGAIAALGVDGRRLRPNIVVGDVDGLAEREWPGRRLQIGDGGDRGRPAPGALRDDHV